MKGCLRILFVGAALGVLGVVCFVTFMVIGGNEPEPPEGDTAPFTIPGTAVIAGQDSDKNQMANDLLEPGKMRVWFSPNRERVTCLADVGQWVTLDGVSQQEDGRWFRVVVNEGCSGWILDTYLQEG